MRIEQKLKLIHFWLLMIKSKLSSVDYRVNNNYLASTVKNMIYFSFVILKVGRVHGDAVAR